MKVGVIGSGYVGLVAAACFAEMGNDVICVDVDENKISKLKDGILPIYEPGLEVLVKENYKRESLKFTTEINGSLNSSEVVFIAVGTPMGDDGSADLKYVLQVAQSIGENMNHHLVVVDKSTVPIGTADKVKKTIQLALDNRNSDLTFDVVSNPEFLKEGAAIDDFLRPDRVVIGAESEEDFELMNELYKPFTRNGAPIIHMDPLSAEMTKYASNAMLATRISFMNEIACICDAAGANVAMVRKGVGTDSRIGQPFLYSGIGYGGSCFPKDVKAIMHTAQEYGYNFQILDAVEAVNADMKKLMLRKVTDIFGEDLSEVKVALWGLAFKPKTDDMREAPAITLCAGLTERGATVNACDPEAIDNAREIIGDDVNYMTDQYQAIDGADVLILATEWNDYRNPDFEKMASLMKRKLVLDGRNALSSKRLAEHGFERYGVGIPPLKPNN